MKNYSEKTTLLPFRMSCTFPSLMCLIPGFDVHLSSTLILSSTDLYVTVGGNASCLVFTHSSHASLPSFLTAELNVSSMVDSVQNAGCFGQMQFRGECHWLVIKKYEIFDFVFSTRMLVRPLYVISAGIDRLMQRYENIVNTSNR